MFYGHGNVLAQEYQQLRTHYKPSAPLQRLNRFHTRGQPNDGGGMRRAICHWLVEVVSHGVAECTQCAQHLDRRGASLSGSVSSPCGNCILDAPQHDAADSPQTLPTALNLYAAVVDDGDGHGDLSRKVG